MKRRLLGCLMCGWMTFIGWSGFVVAQTNYYKPAKSGEIIKIVDGIQAKNPIISSIFEQRVEQYSKGNATWFGEQNRIANGAWILVMSLSPYIQWLVFIGLSLSVVFIIYNGFMIMMNAGDDSQLKTAKENVKYIIIGVLIIGGFFFIMKLVGSLLINLMGG